jgi:transcription elongation factor GreA-like protein
MNSSTVSAIIAKNPSLKTSKTKLEAMEPGAYVIHRSWGFGQIRSYDDAAQRLIIDFKDKASHPMDPLFCATTMEVLPAKHLLVRKETEPERIAKLIAEDPAELIVEGLQAYPNNATTAIDLEITLAQVVGEDKFKRCEGSSRLGSREKDRVLRAARDPGFRGG